MQKSATEKRLRKSWRHKKGLPKLVTEKKTLLTGPLQEIPARVVQNSTYSNVLKCRTYRNTGTMSPVMNTGFMEYSSLPGVSYLTDQAKAVSLQTQQHKRDRMIQTGQHKKGEHTREAIQAPKTCFKWSRQYLLPFGEDQACLIAVALLGIWPGK